MTKTWMPALCLASAAACLSIHMTAQAQSFGAKPGAWETTVATSGIAIPPEVLAKMPPERRAMIEQKMAEAGAGKPQVHRSCVTKEQLDRGFMPNPNSSCTVETVSRTATRLVMNTSCSAPVASKGTMTWEAKSPESVVGVIDQDTGGRKIHIDIVGKWLGASCDGIAGQGAR